MGIGFTGVLGSWIGSEVTIVNPESYRSSALGKGVTFQTYTAKVDSVGDDFLKLTFVAVKGDEQTPVEQIIPLGMIKRLSVWGEEKLIHL